MCVSAGQPGGGSRDPGRMSGKPKPKEEQASEAKEWAMTLLNISQELQNTGGRDPKSIIGFIRGIFNHLMGISDPDALSPEERSKRVMFIIEEFNNPARLSDTTENDFYTWLMYYLDKIYKDMEDDNLVQYHVLIEDFRTNRTDEPQLPSSDRDTINKFICFPGDPKTNLNNVAKQYTKHIISYINPTTENNEFIQKYINVSPMKAVLDTCNILEFMSYMTKYIASPDKNLSGERNDEEMGNAKYLYFEILSELNNRLNEDNLKDLLSRFGRIIAT